MKTLTISLSPHQVLRLHEAVDSGHYASSSEVVREALRLWEQREEIRRIEIEGLKRAYDNGLSSGPAKVIDAKSFLARLNADFNSGV